MVKLNEILKGIETKQIIGNENISVKGIVIDSRNVTNDDLFIAIEGTQVDGHDFIDDAINKGALAVVCSKMPEKFLDDKVYVIVDNTSIIAGCIISNYFDNPSSKLKLIGITGTNGKTTIATVLYNAIMQAGYKSGLISTVNYFVNEKIYDATHTTPDALMINKLLREMVDEGCEYCFMEVSSHAIHQNRTRGLSFEGAVFTNLSHDHLDYHSSFDEYLKVKKRLFDELPSTAFALSNIDDSNGRIMLQNTPAKQKTYALKTMADFNCKIIEQHINGMQLKIENNEVWTHFIGDFNAYNLLAVYAVALLLGLEEEYALKIISMAKPVRGRFEYVNSNDGITAIIDYAHTPDALLNVLKTINRIARKDQEIITVVGAGGDRDKKKRPLMAKIAFEKSHRVILTSDNPRFEDPATILKDMEKGINDQKRKKVITIQDRYEAIKTACNLAEKGSIILVAGKGHETYQEVKGERTPFDDKKVVAELLNIN